MHSLIINQQCFGGGGGGKLITNIPNINKEYGYNEQNLPVLFASALLLF